MPLVRRVDEEVILAEFLVPGFAFAAPAERRLGRLAVVAAPLLVIGTRLHGAPGRHIINGSVKGAWRNWQTRKI